MNYPPNGSGQDVVVAVEPVTYEELQQLRRDTTALQEKNAELTRNNEEKDKLIRVGFLLRFNKVI